MNCKDKFWKNVINRSIKSVSKWKLKSCPRCGGDLLVEKDLYGWSEKCFQCSFSRDLKEVVTIKKEDLEAPTLAKTASR